MAWRMASRTAAGIKARSWALTSVLALAPSGMLGSFSRRPLRLLLKTAPMIATQTLPPIVRKNWFVAVATPRKRQETEFWTLIRIALLAKPRPKPQKAAATMDNPIGVE